MATIVEQTEMVRQLLRFKADPLVVDSNGNNCWHIAAQNSDLVTLKALGQWFITEKQTADVISQRNHAGE